MEKQQNAWLRHFILPWWLYRLPRRVERRLVRWQGQSVQRPAKTHWGQLRLHRLQSVGRRVDQVRGRPKKRREGRCWATVPHKWRHLLRRILPRHGPRGRRVPICQEREERHLGARQVKETHLILMIMSSIWRFLNLAYFQWEMMSKSYWRWDRIRRNESIFCLINVFLWLSAVLVGISLPIIKFRIDVYYNLFWIFTANKINSICHESRYQIYSGQLARNREESQKLYLPLCW